tara:strand:+ start:5655 stop:5894 length:240 start_codon:yes stop_codon:yes gene_type:complete
MDDYYYLLFSIFSIIIALMVIDQSFERLVGLISKLIEVKFLRAKWFLFNDPRNPIVRWFIWRRSLKMAKELRQKIEENK